MLCLYISVLNIVIYIKETKSSHDFNVDYFLEKSLASEIFGKMADIIAEKAAEKISSHLSQKTKSVDLNSHSVDARKDGHEFQSNINVALINDVLSSKIPVKSKLSLKYKLFTKRVFDKTTSKSLRSSENFTDNESDYDIVDNIEVTRNYSSNKIKLNREHNEVADIYTKVNKKELKPEKVEHDKNVKYDKAIEKNGTNKSITKQITTESPIFSLVHKVLNNDSSSRRRVENNVENISTKNNSNTGRHIYKEGNRVFALQSSSDYEDYHKEFNKTIMEQTSIERP